MKHALALSALAATLLIAAPLRAQDGATSGKKTAAKPVLWRVSGKGLKAESYLFGTIHLPDSRVLDLHPAVKKALEESQALYCELAMEPSLQLQMSQKMMLPQGTNLEDIVGQDAVDRVKKLIQSIGLPPQMLLRLKPWALGAQLMVLLEYKNELMSGKQPLDAWLYAQAKQGGKVVGGLEKPEHQLEIFEGQTKEEQQKGFVHTLDQIEKAKAEGKRMTAPLVDAYLSGDMKVVLDIMKKEVGEDPKAKALMKRLLDDRNETMVKEILRHFKEHPDRCNFFAVGTAHYPGKKGIVALLKAKGYTVERITR